MGNMYSNITQTLNYKTSKSIRWCTPSILPEMEKIQDWYNSDMSVSFQSLGFPSEPSGVFQEAYSKAAIAYGSDKTVFTVNGCTGSNFIVLRALSKQIANLKIVAQRNIHKSIVNACQDYDIELHFTNAHIDPHLQLFLPSTIDEILASIKKVNPHVLLITNPTYDGFVLDLQSLIQKAREISPDLIVFVDEAWGAHLTFSDRLPDSAMQAGADICTQSTHKLGGALQQTSLIHWKERRISTEFVMESFRNLSTTSPSYILLSSIDAAREYMAKYGKVRIDRSLEIADQLSQELNKIEGFTTVEIEKGKRNPTSIFDRDRTKIIVDVSQSGLTGYSIARALESDFNIIVEKYNTTTMLFIVPFQNTQEHSIKTITAIKTILKNSKKEYTHKAHNDWNIPNFQFQHDIDHTVQTLKANKKEIIQIDDAIGRISAENITPYPPGIPITIQGEIFTSEIIQFYKNILKYPNTHVVSHDISLNTVLVVK